MSLTVDKSLRGMLCRQVKEASEYLGQLTGDHDGGSSRSFLCGHRSCRNRQDYVAYVSQRSNVDIAEAIARSELEMEQALRGKISLQGFVAYMKRKDAETAVQTLDGADWGGIRLKVGFSKPVPIPSKALYGA